MNDDGIFYTAQGKPYRYEWKIDGKRSYRLEKSAVPPGRPTLPASPEARYTKSHLRGLHIIAAERGGGMGELLQWLQGKGGRSQDQSRRVRAPAANGEKMGTSGDIGSSWIKRTIGEANQAISQALKNGSPFKIAIDLTAGLDSSSNDLGRLASWPESPEFLTTVSSMLVLVRSLHPLLDHKEFSVLPSRGPIYRLPHFSVSELEDWVKALLEKHSSRSDRLNFSVREIAALVKKWVGGQPTLTHALFRQVDEQLKRTPEVDIGELLENMGEELSASSPYVVDKWRHDLELLLERPELRQRLSAYARNAREDPATKHFDTTDVELFLAGWVGIDQEGLWAIRSQCHRQWAREILRGDR